jgi:hypothetical protein
VLGIADRSLARSIEEGLTADYERSREIILEEWRKRSIVKRALERLATGLIEQY